MARNRKLSSYLGDTTDKLLVETPKKLKTHPDDMIPACPFCSRLEIGVIEWIKGYPKFYCYICSISFFLEMQRGKCTRLPDMTISPYICNACSHQVRSQLQKKCIFFEEFLPYPQELLDDKKRQEAIFHKLAT